MDESSGRREGETDTQSVSMPTFQVVHFRRTLWSTCVICTRGVEAGFIAFIAHIVYCSRSYLRCDICVIKCVVDCWSSPPVVIPQKEGFIIFFNMCCYTIIDNFYVTKQCKKKKKTKWNMTGHADIENPPWGGVMLHNHQKTDQGCDAASSEDKLKQRLLLTEKTTTTTKKTSHQWL